MTKQDFLECKSFYLKGDFSNTTTYKMGHKAGSLEREYRMTNDIDNILISDHIFNIEKIGNKMVHLYTFLLGRKIVDKIRYDDMVAYDRPEAKG